MVAEILCLLAERVKPGVTTYELDLFAASEVSRRKARAAFKGYCGYPNTLCCSPNNQVVHGIPNKVPLESGDILSLDFGIFYDEFFGDAAVTLAVGSLATVADSLIKTTEQALLSGIAHAVPGGKLYDISHTIQSVAEQNGYSVVRDFVGHGIGRKLHEDPQLPNYGLKGTGVRLKEGMVLAIEPMVNQKSFEVNVLEDGWTVITCDNGLSAHFEHTVAITKNGPEILTSLS
jgi:methionyl aminopeptidase